MVYNCVSIATRSMILPTFQFPKSAFTGYGGMLEEADEQAVLAALASNGDVVCGLLDELIKGWFSPAMILGLN